MTTPSDKRAPLVISLARRGGSVSGSGGCWVGLASAPGPDRFPVARFPILFCKAIFLFFYFETKQI
jgi:hypothetical protein